MDPGLQYAPDSFFHDSHLAIGVDGIMELPDGELPIHESYGFCNDILIDLSFFFVHCEEHHEP